MNCSHSNENYFCLWLKAEKSYVLLEFLHFCMRLTGEVPCNYLICSSSGHLNNLLLGCTSGCTFGLNLAVDLGPVPALLTT